MVLDLLRAVQPTQPWGQGRPARPTLTTATLRANIEKYYTELRHVFENLIHEHASPAMTTLICGL